MKNPNFDYPSTEEIVEIVSGQDRRITGFYEFVKGRYSEDGNVEMLDLLTHGMRLSFLLHFLEVNLTAPVHALATEALQSEHMTTLLGHPGVQVVVQDPTGVMETLAKVEQRRDDNVASADLFEQVLRSGIEEFRAYVDAVNAIHARAIQSLANRLGSQELPA